MTHRMPLIMGLMMGLMLPFVVHNGAGLAFVLAHVVALVAILAALIFAPLPQRLRRVLSSHRPSLRHGVPMFAAAGVGFVLVCGYCSITGGTHHV